MHATLLISQISLLASAFIDQPHVMQMKTFTIIVSKVCPSCAPMVKINMTSSKPNEKFLKVAKDMHSTLE